MLVVAVGLVAPMRRMPFERQLCLMRLLLAGMKGLVVIMMQTAGLLALVLVLGMMGPVTGAVSTRRMKLRLRRMQLPRLLAWYWVQVLQTVAQALLQPQVQLLL